MMKESEYPKDPFVLSGKKALVFSEPFDSATVPSPNLTVEYVKERIGVDLLFRSLITLREGLAGVDDSRARREMERWKNEATKVERVSAETLLDACRLYILLANIVETEGLSAVSIDCVRYSFSDDPVLPHPCLAFSRLRDEGIAAPCEADISALLTEMLFEQIAGKPTFLGNIAALDETASTVDLTHCVAPLRMRGYQAESFSYCLMDYHDLGKGVSMGVEFSTGKDVTMGAFSKDLRGFWLWPGKILSTGSAFCRSMVRIEVPDANLLHEGAASFHNVMLYGDYVAELKNVLAQMNVSVTGPSNA